jgi:choline dehydrogenase
MTQAMQILFDDNKHATGVKVQSAGRNYTLSARHEVIISSGVFHSPQLLMVSGIGPRETLKQYNIPLIADRPGVGQNMHDTCNAGGITFPVSVISTAIRQRDASYEARAVEQFNANGSGILTNTGGDVLAFEKLPDSSKPPQSASPQNGQRTGPKPNTLYPAPAERSKDPQPRRKTTSASGS